MIMDRDTHKYFKNILNNVQTKGNREIIMAYYNYNKIYILILCMLKGLKGKFLLTPQL